MFLHNSLTWLHIFWIMKKIVSSIIIVLKHVHNSLVILPSNHGASVLSPRTWMATNEKNMMEVMRLLSLGGTRQCSFQLALRTLTPETQLLLARKFRSHGHAPCRHASWQPTTEWGRPQGDSSPRYHMNYNWMKDPEQKSLESN